VLPPVVVPLVRAFCALPAPLRAFVAVLMLDFAAPPVVLFAPELICLTPLVVGLPPGYLFAPSGTLLVGPRVADEPIALLDAVLSDLLDAGLE